MLYEFIQAPLTRTQTLHIPDGFLSVPVAIVAWLVTTIFVLVAIRMANRQLDERQVPLMGVLAAFIFAAQAFNFPVAGGTSGHMLGGALASILLGPWPALLTMTAVISLQALVFQDGGLLAMGANIFIMGIATVWIGYFTYQLVVRLHRFAAAFLAGWLSVEVAAILTAFLLALSGTSALGIVLPAMAGVHALIGIGEGLITAAALTLVAAALPGIFGQRVSGEKVETGVLVAGGVVLALIVGILAAFFASSSPDGLMSVAENLGFMKTAKGPLFNLIPGYAVPGLSNQALANMLAIAVGTILLFIVGYVLARVLRQRHRSSTAS